MTVRGTVGHSRPSLAPDPIGGVPFEPMMRIPVARILVIDDDPEVVDVLVPCLREQGYGVLGAGLA